MKPTPNHRLYLSVLRRMAPEDRLRKAFELSAFSKALFHAGLRNRFPDLPETDLRRLLRDRLTRCHSKTC